MRFNTKHVLLFIIVLLVNACELPHQPGPMPKDIVETEFEPGLNILGVLRADDVMGSSFIVINRALTTEEIYSEYIPNFSPEVDFARVRSVRSGDDYFFSKGEDTTDWGNYLDTTLTIETGESYSLEIQAPGFPLLTANTRIPQKPEAVTGSISVEQDRVTFQLQHDPGAFEYKLYLLFPDKVLEKVVKPMNEEFIEIEWGFSSSNGSPVFLMLSALDENLTRYGNSPISFIPNTYHADGSTVDGGYGCFGSVAITIYEL